MLDPICAPVILEDSQNVVVDLSSFAPEGTTEDDPVFYHFHDAVEIVLFGAGEIAGTAHVDGLRYDIVPNSVFFLPSMCRHGFCITRGQRNRLLLQFDPDLLSDLMPAPNRLSAAPLCCQPGPGLQAQLDQLGLWLLDADSNDGKSLVKRDILRLLLRLLSDVTHKDGALPLATGHSGFAAHHRLDALIQHMRAHPAENLSLDDAAALCHLSPTYFSKVFKRAFGMTYVGYRRSQKLRIAARQLTSSSRQVAQIGFDLGFATPSHFIAAFGEYFQVTPSDYRKRALDHTAAASASRPTLSYAERFQKQAVDWSQLI